MENENNNMPMKDERVKKVEDFLLDPEKVIFESLEEFKSAVTTLVNALSGVDLAQLEALKGKDGVTPQRGVDYMTEADISALEAFILDNIPVIGVDLPSREQVETFIRAEVAKIPRIKGDKGDPGRPGKNGNDGSPDTPTDIIKKIRTLRGKKNQMLQIEDVRGLDNKIKIYDEVVDEVAGIQRALANFQLTIPAQGGGSSGAAEWGTITGTLSDQADLQAALDAKQAVLVSGTNIKTINSTSLLGAGNIAVQEVLVSGTNIKTINGSSLLGAGNLVIGGSVAWGAITGTLSDQTDLQAALDAKVNLDQTVGQTIGTTGARLTKLWAVDITVTNAITGSVTGNAGTATALQNARTIGGVSFDGTANITVATATGGFTISGGNLALGTNSITMTGSLGTTGARLTKGWFTDLEVTNAIAGSITGNAATATALQNARTIGGVSFDGTANITVATATGGFTVSGGNLALGANSLTMTGSIGATGSRVTKIWATDGEFTNMPTVGGTAILTSLTAPQFTTIELGHATDTTLSRIGAGDLGVEGVSVLTLSNAKTVTNKRIQPRTSTSASGDITPDVSSANVYQRTAQSAAITINAPTGTPVFGEVVVLMIKDNGTARAITWNATYKAMGAALPSTTTISKRLLVTSQYDGTDWLTLTAVEQ